MLQLGMPTCSAASAAPLPCLACLACTPVLRDVATPMHAQVLQHTTHTSALDWEAAMRWLIASMREAVEAQHTKRLTLGGRAVVQ
jgi:hypothetical protein